MKTAVEISGERNVHESQPMSQTSWLAFVYIPLTAL